jgi:hypothetical protein
MQYIKRLTGDWWVLGGSEKLLQLVDVEVGHSDTFDKSLVDKLQDPVSIDRPGTVCTYLFHSLVCGQEVFGKRNINDQLPIDDGRVFLLRKHAFGGDRLPCDLVVSVDEPRLKIDSGARTHRVVHQIHVEIVRAQLFQSVAAGHFDVLGSMV